jgi:uncharacterized cupredoxin-like copper-binding protein
LTAAVALGAETIGQMRIRLPLLAAAVLAAALASSATAERSTIQTLGVQVAEWNVVPSRGVVPAGTVKVVVANDGLLDHELEIVRTARWGQELPIRNGRAIGAELAAPILVRPGRTRTATVTLAPGTYALLDNLPGHYALGTAISILVVNVVRGS